MKQNTYVTQRECTLFVSYSTFASKVHILYRSDLMNETSENIRFKREMKPERSLEQLTLYITADDR